MTSGNHDQIVLVGGPAGARRALEALGYVPPLRIRQVTTPPVPGKDHPEPLVYILGPTDGLATAEAINAWLDRLADGGGAPVALLVPRSGFAWCAAGSHPQCCGFLPLESEVRAEDAERILQAARRHWHRRGGPAAVRRARLRWNLSTPEAADSERIWLLVESVLTGLVGPSPDLPRVGMAFSEALTNAVEHGNLDLGSTLKDGQPGGMLRFFEERARRLALPFYARRRIHLAVSIRGARVRIRLRNDGIGFDPSELAGSSPDPRSVEAPCGLGLTMIESLVDHAAISPDGRSITLSHRLRRRAAAHSTATPSVRRRAA